MSTRQFLRRWVVVLIVFTANIFCEANGVSARAEDQTGVEFFEKSVRPILAKRCQGCHSASTGLKKRHGGLSLDGERDWRMGGDRGSALVPGQPDKSLLIRAIRHTDPDLKMPPLDEGGKLSDREIAILERWVTLGAPAPKQTESPQQTQPWDEVFRERLDWWSLKPVVAKPKPGATIAERALEIERLLQAKRNDKQIPVAEVADRRTLIRRLSLLLTGLPPTSDAIQSFTSTTGDGDYERLVDQLLASPHFGERWARHWLDVVRFSETHGNEWNYDVPHAWRYRDYVIRAFNEDLPYDQFVREHIAGDLQPNPRWWTDPANGHRFRESMIGTSFFRFGEVNHDSCVQFPIIGYDILDNQVDTLTKAFQATTVACARCHDHKLDAISTKDYHALLGIVRSTRQVMHTLDGPEVNLAVRRRLSELKTKIRAELATIWRRETSDLSRYLLAAEATSGTWPNRHEVSHGLDSSRLTKWVAALSAKDMPLDHPLAFWRSVFVPAIASERVADESQSAIHPADALVPINVARTDRVDVAGQWKKQSAHFRTELESHREFEKKFTTLADFGDSARSAGKAGHVPFCRWQHDGHGLRHGETPAGDFAINPEGDSVVMMILPAGAATFGLSTKFNGAIRSPLIERKQTHVSFQVMGGHSAAVRLVMNNCQLGYNHFASLKSNAWRWVTFELPTEPPGVSIYAELMTLWDHPKYPDPIATLGGDETNPRTTWDDAVKNPRSWWAITRAVLHDGAEPPRASLSHMVRLLDDDVPTDARSAADLYAKAITSSVNAWADDSATDDDVRWLSFLVQNGLLSNSSSTSPRLGELVAEYRAIETNDVSLPKVIAGVADVGPGFDQPVFIRGDYAKLGETVPRRYLEALDEVAAAGTPDAELRFQTRDGSGRLALAERMASPTNPFTARVMVNRIWQHIFGTGLVKTSDDFGHLGDKPSHPELLDHLAASFVQDGWSMKRLIKSLVMTDTFRRQSSPPHEDAERDPQNILLGSFPTRRLEAEAIRDSMLAVSGRLNPALFGSSVLPYRQQADPEKRLFVGPLDGDGRRSLYIKVQLMESPRFLSPFNLPGGKVTQGRRDMTHVPAQSLALLNDPFVVSQARHWAERLVARSGESPSQRIVYLFEKGLGRPPSPDEAARFETALRELAAARNIAADQKMASDQWLTNVDLWQDLAHVIFNMKEFVFVR